MKTKTITVARAPEDDVVSKVEAPAGKRKIITTIGRLLAGGSVVNQTISVKTARTLEGVLPVVTLPLASPLTACVEDALITPVQFSAAGGDAPYTFTVTSGSLPAGTALSTAGVLSGTPTTPGEYSFTVTATDSSDAAIAGAKAYAWTIDAGIAGA